MVDEHIFPVFRFLFGVLSPVVNYDVPQIWHEALSYCALSSGLMFFSNAPESAYEDGKYTLDHHLMNQIDTVLTDRITPGLLSATLLRYLTYASVSQ